jgi:hypothetical protein
VTKQQKLGLLTAAAVLAGIAVFMWFRSATPNSGDADVTTQSGSGQNKEVAGPAHPEREQKPRVAATAQSESKMKPALATYTNQPDMVDPAQAPPPDEGRKHREELGRLLDEGYGTLPPIDLSDLDRNPQKNSVVEAFRTGAHPERLSMMAKRAPFDPAAWDSSETYRKDYLSVVEPGRAYAPAAPAADLPMLRRSSAKYQETFQGEPVTLAVISAPNSPVTFTSADAASFENDLTTITIQAGRNGVASVQLTATPGVAGDCRVSAASPMASAVVTFIVNAKLPPKQEN